jgi:hypothetical protein
MKTHFEVIAHIPHGSGDAEWRIVLSDRHDMVLAIIDPDMELTDAGEVAQAICDAMNIDPERIM